MMMNSNMYKVFGYTDDCRDFECSYAGFVEAVRSFRLAERSLCVTFICRIGMDGKTENFPFIVR